MSLGILATVGGFLVAATAGTGRDPSPVAFELVRGPGTEACPEHDALASRLASALSAPSSRVGRGAARVAVTITRSADGYLATVATFGPQAGLRRLADHGDDCAGLAEALVLTLSMIVDARPTEAASPPASTEISASLAAVTGAQANPAWQIGASAMASTGILGTATAGVSLDLLWHPWSRIATGLSALWLPARSIGASGGSVRLSLVVTMAKLCAGMPFNERVVPSACVEAGLGGLRGVADDYQDARSVWAPWAVAGGSAALEVRLSRRVSLAARAGYLLSLRDASFSIGGFGRVYDSGNPGWTASLGALLTIP